MQALPYFVMAGLLIVSLGIGVAGGGLFWVVPAVVWVAVIAYAVWDRRAKRREGPGERMAAQ